MSEMGTDGGDGIVGLGEVKTITIGFKSGKGKVIEGKKEKEKSKEKEVKKYGKVN